ncbi:UNVERIFIED_CONTAM: hypothetical protein GTU68_063565 [Idotea baltica]|nr:hypothetical protein [Idotea baltica]
MGSKWTTALHGKHYSAIELSSFVLQSLKRDAEAHLGKTVDSAVVTVPAYFNEEQRRATIAAGQRVGLRVDRILNEPTAAAIAYGFHEGNQDKTAVVIDLGGGTFDVSVVEMFEGALEIRASAGEIFLGGEDFTNALISSILKEQKLIFEYVEIEEPLRFARLRRECEQAKKSLSREETAQVRFPDINGKFYEASPIITVSRNQFEEQTTSVLERCVMPIRRALGDANLKRSEIDEVILVGGATRMSSFVHRIEEIFQKAPRCSINPDEVVALGAAVNAGIIDRHVAPFTLGIETSRDVGGQDREGFFSPIINRNTTIPVSRVQQYGTVCANQTHMKISVYQGESRYIKNNLLLGEFEINGIPLGPRGQMVDVRFTYDLNGVLEVEAMVVSTKRKASQVFTRHAKGLTQAELDNALQSMKDLKKHPRDEEMNSFILRKAERLYMEIPLIERRVLDELIQGFEEVLELRDQPAISQYIEQLQAFFSQYEHDDQGSADYDW